MKYTIDISKTRKQDIYRLSGDKFFGKNPGGKELGFTNYYMIIDGKPFFAISGECHFSRVPENQWEDTIIKMKAGGLNTVATYIFWNHHEEIEGQFRFDGRRNLRKFISICAKHDLYVILRIGPFDHGEVRNGGLPDWLYGKPFEVRSDNEGFMHYAKILYSKVYQQVEGLLFKDGGPIIAAQIENEYMHSAAPWEMTTGISDEWIGAGNEGNSYMIKLKKLAQEVGIDTPFYTCTGWGGAATPADEMIPLWGGYAFWPWMFYHCDYTHPATPEYIYRDNHNSEVTKTYNFEPTYDPGTRPYACCEMGGGMLNYYNYRFQLPYESVDAMANIKMASGCNFLGYYMYRGGNNPHGEKAEYLNECQCPKISYDYQAPIGEFGQLRPSFFRLRTIHLFAKHFADRLCDLVTMLPEGSQDIAPEDQDTLRFAVRTDGEKGFLFINNYQDHAQCKDKTGETVSIALKDGEISFEDVSISAGESAILPFNMEIEGAVLKYATAQPVSVLKDGDKLTYVFFTPDGMQGKFVFDDGEVYVTKKDERDCFVKQCGDRSVKFVVLTRKESLDYTEIEERGVYLAFLSDKPAIYDGENIRIEEAARDAKELSPRQCGPSRFVITIPELNGRAKDTLLQIDYRGDIGNLFDKTGRLVSDNFSNSAVWDTGLREIDAKTGDEYTLYITPTKKDVVVDVSSTMAGRKEKSENYAELISVCLREVNERIIPLEGSREDVLRTLRENGLEIIE